MNVYVHKDRGQSRLLSGRDTADSEDELHTFAARLDLLLSTFHPGTPQHVSTSGHYDITLGERDRALALGARSITPQEDENRR